MSHSETAVVTLAGPPERHRHPLHTPLTGGDSGPWPVGLCAILFLAQVPARSGAWATGRGGPAPAWRGRRGRRDRPVRGLWLRPDRARPAVHLVPGRLHPRAVRGRQEGPGAAGLPRRSQEGAGASPGVSEDAPAPRVLSVGVQMRVRCHRVCVSWLLRQHGLEPPGALSSRQTRCWPDSWVGPAGRGVGAELRPGGPRARCSRHRCRGSPAESGAGSRNQSRTLSSGF